MVPSFWDAASEHLGKKCPSFWGRAFKLRGKQLSSFWWKSFLGRVFRLLGKKQASKLLDRCSLSIWEEDYKFLEKKLSNFWGRNFQVSGKEVSNFIGNKLPSVWGRSYQQASKGRSIQASKVGVSELVVILRTCSLKRQKLVLLRSTHDQDYANLIMAFCDQWVLENSIGDVLSFISEIHLSTRCTSMTHLEKSSFEFIAQVMHIIVSVAAHSTSGQSLIRYFFPSYSTHEYTNHLLAPTKNAKRATGQQFVQRSSSFQQNIKAPRMQQLQV